MDKKVSILGSTGSIGTQALDVVRKHSLSIYALAANRNVALLETQAREFHPSKVCVFDESYYLELKNRLADVPIQILCGMDGLCEIAADTKADILLNSVVGMVGLLPTLTAIDAGLDIALANKETLVAGGSLVMARAAKKGVKIYPVDSEHSAIFQCLQGNSREQLHKIILTASGGPFFGKKRAELAQMTAADALKHPNWNMGNKVTIDSSTLMNKGLEFIEAKWLFDLTPDQIEVVVHRQSVVHSAVEYDDCSVIAQLGVPDMKIPIQYALLYPNRMACPTKHLFLTDYGTLTFEKPDLETFRCLKIAMEACRKGGIAPCVMNGSNEVAVAAFLQGKIGFLEIADLVEKVVETIPWQEIHCYEDVIQADEKARKRVLLEVGN
ncbi:MAG: 1-deoxy-D-xylulose-5-phosphate reductoisomerase [Ruminococcus sp.]|nr:1-deoxy-D-xylulose-5-phosphate reductoisomerase [Ruminococcus sp.]